MPITRRGAMVSAAAGAALCLANQAGEFAPAFMAAGPRQPRSSMHSERVEGTLAGSVAPEDTHIEAEVTASSGHSVLLGVGVLFAGASAVLARKSQQAAAKPGKAATNDRLVAVHAFETEIGVQAPFGFWDPLNFTADGDPREFRRRRNVEIKHGRLAMLATIGYMVPEYFRFPGYLSPSAGLKFTDVPTGLAAVNKVPGGGWAQLVYFVAFSELFIAYNDADRDEPGDLHSRFFGLNWSFGAYGIPGGATIADPTVRRQKLSAELANGRLAMAAIIGMFFQDGLTGQPWGDWSLYTDSPLRAFETEIGVQAPFGFWDPLNFTADGDPREFRRRRNVEIKHGRLAMLATIGYIVPEYFRFPGYLSASAGLKFTDVPTGLAAVNKVPGGGWAQLVYFVAFCELFIAYNDADRDEPGDLHSRFFGLNWSFGAYGIPGGATIADPTVRRQKLSAELANGRLAMAAIIGMFFQDGLTGQPWGDWSLYTDSPLRAFETEIGVQAPFGFWDPLNFTADGDPREFRRRRNVEIKHGRLAMLATIGYIVPEYFRFPGYLSPSAGLKFADVPTGLAAVNKVPGGGWAQLVYFVAFSELFIAYNDADRDEPGDLHSRFFGLNWSFGAYGIPGGATIADPTVRRQKLSAELANGRLAMAAIIGMFFQDGLTGQPWGDWSLYTDSPLRAFETEIGVQAPFGFWDPLNFTADGDPREFRRRRNVEIKHGRLAMLATIGYIVPEYFRFPGYLSASAGLKFTDVPTGLAAVNKVPGGGWAQLVYFVAFCELFIAYNDADRDEPGDLHSRFFGLNWSFGAYGIPGGATIADPTVRRQKLSAELANGRLAMAAIIGMFFQDGLTGQPWGDWSLYTDSPLR